MILYTFCSAICIQITLTTSSSIVWETDKDGFLIPPIDEAAENNTSEQEILPGQVTFYLHSRSYHGVELKDTGDKRSQNLHIFGRYPLKPLKVVIHGWMSDTSSEWIQNVVAGYTKNPRNLNVVVVDWGELAGDSRYYPSSASTEPVGKRVGQFLSVVAEQGFVKAQDIHVVGHSLGAHIAGVAGFSFVGKEKIGRITGLDPAKPGYELSEHSEVLTKDDAVFVDVIHTTAGTSGIFQPDGHADFYPNGGANQPGCDGYSPHIKSYLESITCSHLRVCELFVESVLDYNAFPAKQCPHGVSLPPKKEDCINGSSVLMGDNCPLSASGIYYLETNEGPPYIKH